MAKSEGLPHVLLVIYACRVLTSVDWNIPADFSRHQRGDERETCFTVFEEKLLAWSSYPWREIIRLTKTGM